jgi:hypothetical protein
VYGHGFLEVDKSGLKFGSVGHMLGMFGLKQM